MEELLRVPPGTGLDLSAIDTRSTPGFDGDKSDGKSLLHDRRTRLSDLQDILHAQGTDRLLVVLQSTDTGGKDGTLRHVFRKIDPIGVHARPFGVPTEIERSYDYLWRAHARVPAAGQIVVFNRSHYEDVLVTRIHGTVDDEQAERRFAHIRDFERMLAEEGTTIRKFFLHISKEEQAERLQARLDNPDKNWKFSKADLADRKHFERYQELYEEAIAATSTEQSPWYVVPADRKWYRNLAIASILVETLEGLDLQFPEPEEGLEDVVVE